MAQILNFAAEVCESWFKVTRFSFISTNLTSPTSGISEGARSPKHVIRALLGIQPALWVLNPPFSHQMVLARSTPDKSEIKRCLK